MGSERGKYSSIGSRNPADSTQTSVDMLKSHHSFDAKKTIKHKKLTVIVTILLPTYATIQQTIQNDIRVAKIYKYRNRK